MIQKHQSTIVLALLVCAMLLGAVLRLDALIESFGPYEHPKWLAASQPYVQRIASAVTPQRWRWQSQNGQYSGDPVNYLKFAREMRHFYQAHVREPMFVAATRVSLMLTNDADVGISFVSILCSLLLMVAAYALGRQIASPAVGLAAAVALGIDRNAVGLSVEGWRDEMFGCFVVLNAWVWIGTSRNPSYRRAVLAGIIGAAACLTRITAITFLVPIWIWFYVSFAGDARSRVRLLSTSVGVTLALVAPYLINCAIETGDPLYAINYHTQYYLDKAGAQVRPISAMQYTMEQLASHPLAGTDTALAGLTVHPFAVKWAGLNAWYSGLGGVLSWFAVVGLFAWLWYPWGRLLLLILFASLVPYMLTWNVGGGGDWRFTLHAYPFYLLAAFWLLHRAVAVAQESRHNGAAKLRGQLARPRVRRAAVLLMVLLVASVAWGLVMPYAIARERLLVDGSVVIVAGARERLLFSDGWSDPVVTGNVIARFATKASATMRIPLPESRAYDLRLRMDPLYFRNAPAQKVRLLVNDQLVDVFELTWNPERVGEYRVSLSAPVIRPGINTLTFESAVLLPAGRARPAFRGLARDQRVGFRLWYVLITPSTTKSGDAIMR